MYIHSYQINNVLNTYRKQLSQGSGSSGRETAPAPIKGDRVELSTDHQRQAIIDHVSAEIVDRIARNRTQKETGELKNKGIEPIPAEKYTPASKKETEFTFSVIDENDRKSTNTLPVENFRPLNGQAGPPRPDGRG